MRVVLIAAIALASCAPDVDPESTAPPIVPTISDDAADGIFDVVTPRVCISDVPASFRALDADAPREQSAVNIDVLPFPRYTDSLENSFGLREHFQGVQRL